jgi:TRAP-type C4-dicarboxylate transport system permease small subunit
MLDKFLRHLGRAIEAAVVFGSVVIVGMVVTEVILRKGFGSSLIVTEELARYLLVWMVFLASAIGVRNKSHIRINALVKHFSPRVQIVLAVVAHAVSLIFLGLLFIESMRILPKQFSQSCICFDVPMVCFYVAIPLGCVLMALFMIPHIREILRGDAVESTGSLAEKVDKYTC